MENNATRVSQVQEAVQAHYEVYSLRGMVKLSSLLAPGLVGAENGINAAEGDTWDFSVGGLFVLPQPFRIEVLRLRVDVATEELTKAEGEILGHPIAGQEVAPLAPSGLL
jgi:hypothetical protein